MKRAIYRYHLRNMQDRRSNLHLSDQKHQIKIVSGMLAFAFTFGWNTFPERFWFLFYMLRKNK